MKEVIKLKWKEVDQETLDLIEKYNTALTQWNAGIKWLLQPNLSENKIKQGEERLQLRLNQMTFCYNELTARGIEVIAEEYIDVNKFILKPPF